MRLAKVEDNCTRWHDEGLGHLTAEIATIKSTCDANLQECSDKCKGIINISNSNVAVIARELQELKGFKGLVQFNYEAAHRRSAASFAALEGQLSILWQLIRHPEPEVQVPIIDSDMFEEKSEKHLEEYQLGLDVGGPGPPNNLCKSVPGGRDVVLSGDGPVGAAPRFESPEIREEVHPH